MSGSIDSRVEALAIDTNALGSGLPLNRLRSWKDLLEDQDMELWISELVLWEAAIHVVEAAREFSARIKKAAKLLTEAGLEVPKPPVWGSTEDIVEGLIFSVEQFAPEIVVVDCEPDLALKGLLDQIKQAGPASIKGDVRTGAVDSAWLRSIQSWAAQRQKKYVIVSNDDDIRRIKDQWSLPTIYPDLYEARKSLFRYTPAGKKMVAQVIGYIAELVSSLGEGQSIFDGPDFQDLTGLMNLIDPADSEEEFREAFAEIKKLGPLVGLRVLENDRQQGSLLVEAWLVADLDIQGWIDAFVDGEITLRMESESISDCVLLATLNLQTNEDEIQSVALEIPIEVLPQSMITAADEVFEALTEPLGLVPGLDGYEIAQKLGESGSWEGQLLNGEILTVSVSPSDYKDPSAGQRLDAAVGAENCSVSWYVSEDISVFEDSVIDESICVFDEEEFSPAVWKISAWLLSRLAK